MKAFPVMTPDEAWVVVGRICEWADPYGFAYMAIHNQLSDKTQASRELDRAIKRTGSKPKKDDGYAHYYRSEFYHEALKQFKKKYSIK